MEFYFIRSKRKPYGPLKDFSLLVEIGSESDEVYRDKGKIEGFLQTMLEKFFNEILVYPNRFTIDKISEKISEKIKV